MQRIIATIYRFVPVKCPWVLAAQAPKILQFTDQAIQPTSSLVWKVQQHHYMHALKSQRNHELALCHK